MSSAVDDVELPSTPLPISKCISSRLFEARSMDFRCDSEVALESSLKHFSQPNLSLHKHQTLYLYPIFLLLPALCGRMGHGTKQNHYIDTYRRPRQVALVPCDHWARLASAVVETRAASFERFITDHTRIHGIQQLLSRFPRFDLHS